MNFQRVCALWRELLGRFDGPFLFGDFSMYAFVERQGVTLSRNPYLYQANGQIGLFVKQRFGGAVLQSAALKYLTLGAT